MKITFVLKETIYDCSVKITDSAGERIYYISSIYEEGMNYSSITAEVFDSDFLLSLIPVMTDKNAILEDIEVKDWKDKLAKIASSAILNSIEKTLLRVGCDYKITGVQDGDRLDISLQNYVYGTFDRFDILELVPMCYVFYEVSSFNERFELVNAFEINRKDILNFARSLALLDVGGNGIFALITYPIQVNRIKHLSKNKKIFKTLKKFNNLSESDRRRFLEKQEKFFDKY